MKKIQLRFIQLRFMFTYIFTKNKSYQQKLDWNWMWKVEFIDWLEKHFPLYLFRKHRDDDLPF